MAYVNYTDVNYSARGGETSNVNLFSIKNDKGEAYVRILVDDVDHFEILTAHPATINGNPYRKVNCIRTATDHIENCPFCAAGTKVMQRVFLRMIQYDIDTVSKKATPKAAIWDRPAGFIQDIVNLLNTYGPLSEIVCKVVRNGTGLDTSYTVLPLPADRFTKQNFPMLDGDPFANFTVLGRFVLNKTAADMVNYLQTGSFTDPTTTPASAQPKNLSSTPAASSSVNNSFAAPAFSAAPAAGWETVKDDTELPF